MTLDRSGGPGRVSCGDQPCNLGMLLEVALDASGSTGLARVEDRGDPSAPEGLHEAAQVGVLCPCNQTHVKLPVRLELAVEIGAGAALSPDTADERPLTSKVAGLRLKQDDRIAFALGGGGGWGDPRERDPELVRQDVVREYVSREAAAGDYGVALRADLTIDQAATARLRGNGTTA